MIKLYNETIHDLFETLLVPKTENRKFGRSRQQCLEDNQNTFFFLFFILHKKYFQVSKSFLGLFYLIVGFSWLYLMSALMFLNLKKKRFEIEQN